MPASPGRGLEALVDRFPDVDSTAPRAREAAPHAEVVIVGSGYGAAVAASVLARSRPPPAEDGPIPVCILERGAEYPPGAFPTGLAELPGHVRFIKNMLAGGAPVGKYQLQEYWLDIGQIPDYERAQQAYEQHFARVEAEEPKT